MNRILGAMLIALLTIALPAAADEALQVEGAWVREGPPHAEVLAGFMKLHNGSDSAVDVTGVSSTDFERVEMHRSIVTNGMAKMIAQDKLTVPAKGDLLLAPGGYHLMLFNPKGSMRAGQHVTFVLHTASGGSVTARAEVRKSMGGMDMGNMEHQH